MHKSKKESRTAKLPKPMKVKKEKSDEDRLPQPMTYYLDDRLEMVKQIFNTLKPKTIVNLAPDFLKTQALEEIEEACLNELLCISTKRLKSIITATKCPTDTESSDSDSDVERHEEHISLEEISSDSEIEGSTSKKGRRKKSSKFVEETESFKKNTPNDDNQGDGHISVLELLELQARARAIRSQLALEPVTKIEVDSDEEVLNGKDKSKSSKKDDKSKKHERKRVSSEMESTESVKVSRMNGSTESINFAAHNEKETAKITSKKIKLKRTHRNSTKKEKENEHIEKPCNEASKEEKEKNEQIGSKEKSKEQEKNNSKETLIVDIKKEKRSRSPSPDVIPIVPEPETLLITDSSDDEKKLCNKNEALKSNAEKVINGEEASMQKEQQGTQNESTEVAIDKEKSSDKELNKAQNLPEPLSNADGSVCGDDTQGVANKNTPQNNDVKNKNVKLANKEKSKQTDGSNYANHSDDDQNDDVISLGGDLENEMNQQLENEVNARQSPYNKKTTEESSQDNNKSQDESQAEDVVSLASSEDERASATQSWHSRYMKSSKVSKVLAASRLGKRVRDKIKKSKNSKKETMNENSDAEKDKSIQAFTSKHEDGSVEQYKELLEMRQRKSS